MPCNNDQKTKKKKKTKKKQAKKTTRTTKTYHLMSTLSRFQELFRQLPRLLCDALQV